MKRCRLFAVGGHNGHQGCVNTQPKLCDPWIVLEASRRLLLAAQLAAGIHRLQIFRWSICGLNASIRHPIEKASSVPIKISIRSLPVSLSTSVHLSVIFSSGLTDLE